MPLHTFLGILFLVCSTALIATYALQFWLLATDPDHEMPVPLRFAWVNGAAFTIAGALLTIVEHPEQHQAVATTVVVLSVPLHGLLLALYGLLPSARS